MKNKTFNVILFITLWGLMLSSCRDLIEVDIKNAKVQLYTPSNNATSSILRQTFDWADVDGARSYHIQCVQNTFDSSAIFVFDTTVTKSQFVYTMRVGNFQWRVQAVNNGYNSPYSTSSFRVDSTSSLANQLVVLQSPASGTYSSQNSQTLTWQTISIADSFLIQIDTGGFLNSTYYLTKTVARNKTLNDNDTIIVNLPERSVAYQWRVKAKNKTTTTDFSSTWNITIDQTSPDAPTLVNPTYGSIVSSSSTSLTWTRNGTDVTFDSLYVYKSDSTTLLSNYPKQVNALRYSLTSLSRDSTYYWRVKSTDRAGNVGPFPARRFKFKAVF